MPFTWATTKIGVRGGPSTAGDWVRDNLSIPSLDMLEIEVAFLLDRERRIGSGTVAAYLSQLYSRIALAPHPDDRSKYAYTYEAIWVAIANGMTASPFQDTVKPFAVLFVLDSPSKASLDATFWQSRTGRKLYKLLVAHGFDAFAAPLVDLFPTMFISNMCPEKTYDSSDSAALHRAYDSLGVWNILGRTPLEVFDLPFDRRRPFHFEAQRPLFYLFNNHPAWCFYRPSAYNVLAVQIYRTSLFATGTFRSLSCSSLRTAVKGVRRTDQYKKSLMDEAKFREVECEQEDEPASLPTWADDRERENPLRLKHENTRKNELRVGRIPLCRVIPSVRLRCRRDVCVTLPVHDRTERVINYLGVYMEDDGRECAIFHALSCPRESHSLHTLWEAIAGLPEGMPIKSVNAVSVRLSQARQVEQAAAGDATAMAQIASAKETRSTRHKSNIRRAAEVKGNAASLFWAMKAQAEKQGTT
ncbi:hypothetical protein JCM3770_003945 [Rhodotorula araucariae]